MESTRQHKIARLLQKELGDLFRRETAHIAGKGMITVTKVQVSGDLGVARVYLSLFTAENKEHLLEKIRDQTGEFRYKLGRRIGKQVRIVPEIRFYLDDSLDYIDHIEKLLDE